MTDTTNAISIIPLASHEEDIPLLPGESIHLGYIPLDEETAFKLETFQRDFSYYNFAVPRNGPMTIDRIVALIHLFTRINHDINVIVPKRIWLNEELAQRNMYESKILFQCDELCATIKIRVIAVKSTDEFSINVDLLRGSRKACSMLYNTLEKYILSNGKFYPIIRDQLASPSFPDSFDM